MNITKIMTHIDLSACTCPVCVENAEAERQAQELLHLASQIIVEELP